MYEHVFKLHTRPFTSTPYAKHYFAAQSMHKALTQCQACVERGAGPAVVVGHSGTGKSLLLTLLADRFRSDFRIVNLACSRLEKRHDLLQSILFNLDQPYRDMSEVELRLTLIDYLKPNPSCPSGVVLLVDEAHHLSSDLLDEVRLITNIVYDGQPKVRLVMAGGHRFEENLTDPKLEPFNQRIAARCFLGNLNRDETTAYVLDHLYRAGGDGQSLFTVDALNAIHDTSDGCPRVINQICDQALLLAASAHSANIDEQLVGEAWAEIQCLPGSPASVIPNDENTEMAVERFGNFAHISHDEEEGSVIEFGELDSGNSSQSAGELGGVTEDLERHNGTWHVEHRKEDVVQAGHGDTDATVEFSGFVDEGTMELESLPLETDAPLENPEYPEVHTPHLEMLKTLAANSAAENEICSLQEELKFADDSKDESIDLGDAGNLPNSIENPFSECFAHEELILDRYALNAAEQNIKSLEVTSDHMQLLEECADQMAGGHPSQPECDIPEGIAQDSQPQKSFVPETISPMENRNPAWPDPQFQVFPELPGKQQIEIHSTSDLYTLAPLEEELSDDLRLTDDELKQLDSVTSAVERMERHQSNDDLLSPLDACENLIDAPTLNGQTREVTSDLNGQVEPAIADSMDEAHRLLDEIRRFTQGTDETGGSLATHTPKEVESANAHGDSLAIEYPVTQHEGYQAITSEESATDDRDMLIVSRAEQLNVRAAEADGESEVSYLTDGPSTGQACRMDYHELFEQLRSE
ncbi:MAG: AAA family ATPase [Mariniblastus sp.]|nr:AAA family ATPase [Mariniblastus sp.]